MRRALLVTLATGLLLAGCGSSSRSILYSGVSPGITGKRTVISDATALRDGRAVRRQWMSEIARDARKDPRRRFANLPLSAFRHRLAAAAAHYDFTVKTVRFLHPRQAAPLVVVETRHYLDFSRAVPAIERSLDPWPEHHTRHVAFEAFYLEGRDERGVPFVIVSNVNRGEAGGSQWARSEALYPFAHG